jgi:transposase-like protein
MADPHPIIRWTPRCKAAVVEQLLQGLTTPEKISADHGVGPEELASWCENYQRCGLGGLKATRPPPIRTTEARLRFRGGAGGRHSV